MSKSEKTYKATGITLKSMPMGESDRLLTILTKEHGLVRAVTPGARKPKSSLRAISTAFVVGDLLIVKGRSLDKLIQADCRASFPGLSRDLGKLTAAQYLAELALSQALSQTPQEELFTLLNHHLNQIAQRPPDETLSGLVHGIFQFLTVAGVVPQVQYCCLTQRAIAPDFTNPSWMVGFDASAGGIVDLNTASHRSEGYRSEGYGSEGYEGSDRPPIPYSASTPSVGTDSRQRVSEPKATYSVRRIEERGAIAKPIPKKKSVRQIQLNAYQLLVLQHLAQPDFMETEGTVGIERLLTAQHANFADEEESQGHTQVWLMLERVLRQYSQYHFDQPIRSAALIETCFLETMG